MLHNCHMVIPYYRIHPFIFLAAKIPVSRGTNQLCNSSQVYNEAHGSSGRSTTFIKVNADEHIVTYHDIKIKSVHESCMDKSENDTHIFILKHITYEDTHYLLLSFL